MNWKMSSGPICFLAQLAIGCAHIDDASVMERLMALLQRPTSNPITMNSPGPP